MDPIEYHWKLLAGDLADLLADERHAELPNELRLSDAIFGPYPEPDQSAAMRPEAVEPVVWFVVGGHGSQPVVHVAQP